jgi:phenylpropionate dioxygenase-like ring-hydroxylating dioxygenase large terminal subunit
VQEILRRDGGVLPHWATTQAYQYLGNDTLSAERYTSQAFFDLEMEKMWPKVWQFACREEHILQPGDYYVYEIGPYSFVLVRTKDGDVKAYYNSCLHRGTKLKPSNATGCSPRIQCPYHGWTWSLEGSLVSVPCAWDFPHVDATKFSLPEVKVARWGGFVFINMDENCIPFEEYAGVLPEHLRNFALQDRYISAHVEKELHCNWKIASEAFLESYHFKYVHPQILPVAGDVNAQYDLFGDHVSRLYGLMGVPSPNCEREYSEQEVLEMMITTADGVERPVVPPGHTARDVMADSMRKLVLSTYGKDATSFSNTELIDSIHYFLFPNLHNFVSLAQRQSLRIRPLGMSPDRCLFEIINFSDVPAGQECPEAASPVRVKENELIQDALCIDRSVGAVYDQDMGNLTAQHAGLLASKLKQQTLANYQEVRIRHSHRTIDKYLGLNTDGAAGSR